VAAGSTRKAIKVTYVEKSSVVEGDPPRLTKLFAVSANDGGRVRDTTSVLQLDPTELKKLFCDDLRRQGSRFELPAHFAWNDLLDIQFVKEQDILFSATRIEDVMTAIWDFEITDFNVVMVRDKWLAMRAVRESQNRAAASNHLTLAWPLLEINLVGEETRQTSSSSGVGIGVGIGIGI
jgi:hypothetical protein